MGSFTGTVTPLHCCGKWTCLDRYGRFHQLFLDGSVLSKPGATLRFRELALCENFALWEA